MTTREYYSYERGVLRLAHPQTQHDQRYSRRSLIVADVQLLRELQRVCYAAVRCCIRTGQRDPLP